MPEESNVSLFIAGAMSGFVEAVVVQPFDMLKTRHQLNTSHNQSVIKSLFSIYQEGGIFRFYRGFIAEAIGIVPKSSGMYASYELAKVSISATSLGDSTLTCSIAGFISGIPEALIVTPTQVVKVRLQAREYLGYYKNSADCLIKIVRQEGPLALSIGLGPTLWRNCVWNTVYFGTMHLIKKKLPNLQKSSMLDHLQNLLSGFVGALFATCFNAPFDVVKSRFQSQQSTNKVLKYRNTIQSLQLIYKEEGLAACYKGFQPKAIRMGLGGGVAMMTFEFTKSFLNSKES